MTAENSCGGAMGSEGVSREECWGGPEDAGPGAGAGLQVWGRHARRESLVWWVLVTPESPQHETLTAGCGADTQRV